ncbi:MAG: hypothetical protein IPK68_04685 [Bdellovibrionales bacterium]|nr:hypothetical protein [Bdellovibrionales bacterium]
MTNDWKWLGKSIKQIVESGSGELLQPGQVYINPSIVDRYITRLKSGEQIKAIEVIQTPTGKMIQNGHHRYVASKIAKKEVAVVVRGSGPIKGPNWEELKYSNNIGDF